MSWMRSESVTSWIQVYSTTTVPTCLVLRDNQWWQSTEACMQMTLWNWFLNWFVARFVMKSYADYVLICNLLGIKHQCSLQSSIWAFGKSDWQNLRKDQFGDLLLSSSSDLESDELCIIMHACFATQTFTWSEHELQSLHSGNNCSTWPLPPILHFVLNVTVSTAPCRCAQMTMNDTASTYILFSEFWPVHSVMICFVSQ
jgi:hypothetical protein